MTERGLRRLAIAMAVVLAASGGVWLLIGLSAEGSTRHPTVYTALGVFALTTSAAVVVYLLRTRR